MSDPGFTFYADNFLGGTMFMTDAQVGKYVRALCAQKLNGPLTEDEIQGIVHGDQKVMAKFTKNSEGLHYNTRLQKEIDKRLQSSQKQRDRINKRWNRTDTAVLPGNESGNTSMMNTEIETELDTGIGIKKGIVKGEEIEKRSESFKNEVKTFSEKYPSEMLQEFFKYWSEPNRSKTKMRFELQPTWELSRRLTTWANRDKMKNQDSPLYQKKGYQE
jgi:hypothetical protein